MLIINGSTSSFSKPILIINSKNDFFLVTTVSKVEKNLCILWRHSTSCNRSIVLWTYNILLRKLHYKLQRNQIDPCGWVLFGHYWLEHKLYCLLVFFFFWLCVEIHNCLISFSFFFVNWQKQQSSIHIFLSLSLKI